MNATFLDEDGKPQLIQMGCYGIGITRIAGRRHRAEPRRARHHLADAIAPFAVVICPIGMDRSAEVKAAAELHDELPRPAST